MSERELNIVVGEQSARIVAPSEYNPSILIANAASVSRLTNMEMTLDACIPFVKRLMGWKHFSPFEFFDVQFFCHTSRAVANELVRHRMASYMQESQRHCPYHEFLEVMMPTVIAKGTDAGIKAWMNGIRASYEAYLVLLDEGARLEDARTVLPVATSTIILVKMNLRSFRNFLDLRTHKAAWSEMRDLARKMAKAFQNEYPQEYYLIEDVVHPEEV